MYIEYKKEIVLPRYSSQGNIERSKIGSAKSRSYSSSFTIGGIEMDTAEQLTANTS